jgi:hypothetical protein
MYGFLIAANYCQVINCIVRDAWQAVSTETSGNKNGDGCIVMGCSFEKCRNGVVLDSINNKVFGNKFSPPVAINATGTYYAPITVRATRTGQHVIGNYFERTPAGTDDDSAIWQASAGLVTKCMNNSFSGWGEQSVLDAPGDVYPFWVGAYGAIAQDDTFYTEWKDRNFFD